MLRHDGGRFIDEDGKSYIDFSSNDYLGLSQHERLQEVAIRAVREYGVGSTGSRLITGTTPAHSEAEGKIAHYKGTEAALLFANGMMAAHGVIKALFGKEDTIILDKLSHACLIDAARECGARVRVFGHNNLERLEALLKSEREKVSGRLLVVVEAVYSMDGDCCPLAEIVRLKNQYGALLLMDEAHSLGVLGAHGMGLAEELGLQEEVDLQMGTLGKAAGGAGGYIACSTQVRDMMVNKARSFIFTTAAPPSQALVASEALDLIASAEGAALREALKLNRELMQELVDEVPSAICAVILGSNDAALNASNVLRAKGYLVPAIRYPTVARGQARLRVTLSALHQKKSIQNLIQEVSALMSVQ